MDFSLLSTSETLGYVMEKGFFPEGQVGCATFVLECLRIFRNCPKDYINDTILEIAAQLGVTFSVAEAASTAPMV